MAAYSRAFFTDFPNSKPNPDASVDDELNEYQTAWKESHSGLPSWQQLCEELDLRGPFTSLKQFKKTLSKVHVNIVDLLDCRILEKKTDGVPESQSVGELYQRNRKSL
ncbi:hypothetical protein KXX57_000646 [Aspergillus fumigatus]|nr:hypothetical protein KXX57_000646 [Aspergillus fumigatus]KAH2664102.1 hypothetical protein KXV32_008166 [Aspergillus fumigatus]KAH3197732.1 hypothetical protein KXW62_002167 [Aspergillus fumigatus]